MLKFFNHLRIKHQDLPYLLVYSILMTVILIALGYLFDIIELAVLLSVAMIFILTFFFHFSRRTEEMLKYNQQKNQSLLSIYNTLEPEVPLPFMTGWAAEPELISTILKEVAFTKPSLIFEIGSGTSTVTTSLFLKKSGSEARIVSIDHDANYYNPNKASLVKYGVDDIVDLHHTPLKKQHVNGNDYLWYDISNIQLDQKIDLLVIDGPPFETNKNARYPAVPLLIEHLSDRAVIILDDASRKDENWMARKWAKDYPGFSFEFVGSEKGLCILRRSN